MSPGCPAAPARLLALHHRERLELEIDVLLAVDVDDRLPDRAAGERVREAPA
jgi:hypothetical protein